MRREDASVSAIVCVHLRERLEQLEACITSLRRQQLKPQEIIVVVDGQPELCAELRARGIADVVLSTPSPSGLSAARNVGIAQAAGALLAFLDDDAIADERWLGSLINVLDESDVAGAGGVSRPVWTDRPPRWFPMELLWTVGCSYAGLPEHRSPAVRNIFGGCAVLRRELFEELGGFDPELGRTSTGLGGCEETEFCMRVLEAHPEVRFVYEPAAVIYHYVPRSRQRIGYVLRRCRGEGRSKAILYRRTRLPVRRLGPERDYVLRTVPRAVQRYLRHALCGDPSAAARAGALVLSVWWTIWSFLITSLRLLPQGSSTRVEPAPLPAPSARVLSREQGRPGRRGRAGASRARRGF